VRAKHALTGDTMATAHEIREVVKFARDFK